MPFKKGRRKNTQTKAWKYWAHPTEKPPEQLWITARAMAELWNKLVVGRDAVSEKLKAEEPDDDERKATWAAWSKQATAFVAESGLNWECGPTVLARFETACRVAAKTGVGWPKLKRGVGKNILIPHRFTGGGTTTMALTSERNKRFYMAPVPDSAYKDNTAERKRARLTHGRFGLDDGQSIEFKAVVHRPLPVEAWVKAVAWSGEFIPAKREWEWNVVISVESPRVSTRATTGRSAGVDVGWRRMVDRENGTEYLRIGMLADSDGALFELRLPLEAETSHDRRHANPYTSWRGLADMDTRIAFVLDNMKARLKPLRRQTTLLKGLTLMRQGGLIRTLALARTELPEIVPMLEEWKVENDRLRSWRQSLYARLTRRREWLYRNLVRWIADNYDEVAIEDIKVKPMIEEKKKKEKKNFALEAARRWHQTAATGEFLANLKQAAEKHQILPINPAWSTIQCYWCQGMAEPGGDLMLMCPNGHYWDQDINAARNLLSQTSWGLENDTPPRKAGTGKSGAGPAVPMEIKTVVKIVHLD